MLPSSTSGTINSLANVSTSSEQAALTLAKALASATAWAAVSPLLLRGTQWDGAKGPLSVLVSAFDICRIFGEHLRG
jgi:hypothetical protein